MSLFDSGRAVRVAAADWSAVTHPTTHLTTAQLEAALPHLRSAPRERGTVELVCRRPAVGEREILEVGELDPEVGLVGDTWRIRGSKRTADGSSHPDMQLNVMSHRMVALLAEDDPTRALAGDQLYLDLDLSVDNLPAGTRLALGEAVIEVTDQPHTGCAKFVDRFGPEAMRFVNGPTGRPLRLRGLNARVVTAGRVRPRDVVTKL